MSTQDEAVIEAVAKKLHEASKTYEPGIGTDEWYVGWPAMAEEAIRAYLSALDKAGWAVVPKVTGKTEDAPGDAFAVGSSVTLIGGTRKRYQDAVATITEVVPIPGGKPRYRVRKDDGNTIWAYHGELRLMAASPPPPGADTSERQP